MLTIFSFMQYPNALERNEVAETNVSDARNNITTPNFHGDAWTCCLCDFECKKKKYLREHITSIHKDPSNPNLFKCTICDYKTEYLHKLAMHQPQHKSTDTQYDEPDTQDVQAEQEINSEPKKQKCGLCDFTYENKNDLGEHIMSSHKDPSDSNKFKCNICGYVTEYFHRLILHVSYHKHPRDPNWYHCHKCSYRSRQKSNLKQHVAKHTDSTKADFYKCPSQSVAHSYLLKHLLVEDPLGEQWHQCDICEYKSKFKSNLKSHMLKHKDFDEVEMFNCDTCQFRTKRKRSLNTHIMRRHNDSF